MRVERFREARAKKGVGINQLARLLGVSTTAVSNWQNGKSKPKPEMLTRIAAALDVEADYLDDRSAGPALSDQPRLVADVLTEARRELAKIMGLPEGKIHLELKTHA